MDISYTRVHKSIKNLRSFSLPKFCVLTGKNGSGKSHLLELLSDLEKARVAEDGRVFSRIKYIPFNGLNPSVDEQCDSSTITNHVRNLWNVFLAARTNLESMISNGQWNSQNDTLQHLFNWVGDARQQRAITNTVVRSKLDFHKVSEDSFRHYLDLKDVLPEEMFAGQFATVFKQYHLRLDENYYFGYLNREQGGSYLHLTKEEFVAEYGPPPWDLINAILANAKLPYRVNSPVGESRDTLFRLRLLDDSSGLEIAVSDLSTGEKVLMSLALAVYNSTGKDGKLDLLLLDEPDAALHPEFSKVLIETLERFIVREANVNVILTTHSPTTVAACNGIAVYEMSRREKVPEKRTLSEAIDLLTDGLSGVRITADKRRLDFPRFCRQF